MEPRDHRSAGDGRPAGLPTEPVYLDYNATTPVDARVAEAARPYWDQWFGNPSSDHAYSERPRQAVARAREQVAALIGAAPGEIVFTGSGSEADQLAIRGAVLAGLRAAPGAANPLDRPQPDALRRRRDRTTTQWTFTFRDRSAR
jgi:cysteine desulfurase